MILSGDTPRAIRYWRADKARRKARASSAALGRSVLGARDAAYAALDRIEAPDLFCRRDIGQREIARETARED